MGDDGEYDWCGVLLLRRLHDVEVTACPRRVGESLVGREEGAAQGLGQSDVARVVRRGVVSQLPCTAQEWGTLGFHEQVRVP